MWQSEEDDQDAESSAEEVSEGEVEEEEAQSESIDDSLYASSNTSYNRLLIKSKQEDNTMKSYFRGGKDTANLELKLSQRESKQKSTAKKKRKK